MTDNEKLDLVLSEIQDMKSDMLDMKSDMLDMKSEVLDTKKDVNSLKHQLVISTADLKTMDKAILDEVERIHGILDKHKADKSVHTA